jgi:hypothetical protein
MVVPMKMKKNYFAAMILAFKKPGISNVNAFNESTFDNSQIEKN